MSYNIDHVECVVLDAWMYERDIRRIRRNHKSDLPDGNFLEEHRDADIDAEGRVSLSCLNWYGDGSGGSYEGFLIPIVAPLIHGRVDAVFFWEGGDSVTALRIRDGVAEEMNVRFELVPK